MVVLRPSGSSSGGGASGPVHFAVAEKVLSASTVVAGNQRAWTYDSIEIPLGTSLEIALGGEFRILDWP